MNHLLRSMLLVVLIVMSLGCNRDSLSIPAGSSFFTLGDRSRMARFVEHDFIAERVDPTDTTRVLVSRKLNSNYFIQTHTSKVYRQIFELNNDVFQPGINKICRVRFRYEGLPGVVDWFEFRNLASEWINPTDVKFNGQAIPRQDSDEPVKNSYLYVLQ